VICKQLQNKFLFIYAKNIKLDYCGKINLAHLEENSLRSLSS
jgi:hypothetical protein